MTLIDFRSRVLFGFGFNYQLDLVSSLKMPKKNTKKRVLSISSDESGSELQPASKITRSRSRPATIPRRYDDDYTLNVSSVEESFTNSKLIVSAVYVIIIMVYSCYYGRAPWLSIIIVHVPSACS